MQAWATGGTFAEISKSKFCELEIPLPPLEVQKEIVAEIEGYQKVIAGNRELIVRFEKKIRDTLADLGRGNARRSGGVRNGRSFRTRRLSAGLF